MDKYLTKEILECMADNGKANGSISCLSALRTTLGPWTASYKGGELCVYLYLRSGRSDSSTKCGMQPLCRLVWIRPGSLEAQHEGNSP